MSDFLLKSGEKRSVIKFVLNSDEHTRKSIAAESLTDTVPMKTKERQGQLRSQFHLD